MPARAECRASDWPLIMVMLPLAFVLAAVLGFACLLVSIADDFLNMLLDDELEK